MTCIKVKFIGQSNTRPSRLKASAGQGRSVTLSKGKLENMASDKGINNTHALIALLLCEKMNWQGKLIEGFLADGSNDSVFVFLPYDLLMASRGRTSSHVYPTFGFSDDNFKGSPFAYGKGV